MPHDLSPATPMTVDMARVIARLNVALEERDHWRQEARREHKLVESRDAELMSCRQELEAAQELANRMRLEREQWAAVAHG